MAIMTGNVHKYKDNINTDIISPPAYMELPLPEMSKHTMCVVDTEFAARCKEGDIFVAEKNLGSGSSRETAPLSLRYLGIRTILAKSYARIFYRNCINLGILAIECEDTDKIDMGDVLSVDTEAGIVKNLTKNEEYPCDKVPEHLMKIIRAGGLVGYLKERLEA